MLVMWYPNQYITCSNCLERCRNIVYIGVKVIVLNAGITGTELSCSCTVLFHIIQNSIFFIFPRIKNFLDECTSSTLFDISNAAAVFFVAVFTAILESKPGESPVVGSGWQCWITAHSACCKCRFT